MRFSDVYPHLKAAQVALQDLQGCLATYEAQFEMKESELVALDAKIAAKRAENQAAESKASLTMGKAAEDSAIIRRQASEMLATAQAASARAKQDVLEAQKIMAECRARSIKVEADEKAVNANSLILERKKSAIESALHAG